MQKKNIKLFFIACAIMLCCFFSTVAYSAIYTTMSINGVAYARVVKDVRITDFKLNSSSTNSTSSYEEFSVNTISTQFNLVDSSSSIVFDVEVTNYGSADVGILNLIGTIPTGLSYEIINYNLKDKICDDTGKCNQMAVKTFQIKFTGNPGEYEINLELDFRTYHNVTYTDITNNGYPTEVIDGGNLNVTFTENLKRIAVLSGGTEIYYYSSISNAQTITLENVSDDIEFKVKELVARLVSGKIDEVGSEVCIKDECFYIISNDGSTVTMLAKYNLHVGNSVDEDFNFTPLSNPTGIQDETAIGYNVDENYDRVFPFIGTTLFSNSCDGSYYGSIVEGYVNDYGNYLKTLGANFIEARLILFDEIKMLPNYNNLSFLYTSSYWTMSYDDGVTYVVRNSGAISDDLSCETADAYGVRPVIEISVDDIYVPPVINVVRGDINTAGSEVCIEDECFYVMSNNNGTVTMLAKYNLYVGGEYKNGTWTAYGDEATGIQNSDMYGWNSSGTYKGVTLFATQDHKGSTLNDYNGSIVKDYVDQYKVYLESLGAVIQNARLINSGEASSLGCSSMMETCSGTFTWLWRSSYWTSIRESTSSVWTIFNDTVFGVYSWYGYSEYSSGVRPVIEISSSEF